MVKIKNHVLIVHVFDLQSVQSNNQRNSHVEFNEIGSCHTKLWHYRIK